MSPVHSGVTVHQLAPAVFPDDGLGGHVLAVRDALRRGGIAGGTWAERFDRRLRPLVRLHRASGRPWAAGHGGALLYQLATGSEGMAEWILRRPEPLALYYHGIAPAECFSPYDGLAAAALRRGRRELSQLAGRARLAFAVSELSAAELRDLGMTDVRVLPPYSPRLAEPDRRYLQRIRRTEHGMDLLFAGHLSPHEGHLAMVRVAALLRAGTDRPVRMFLVGGPGPHCYVQALRRLIDRLGVADVVWVTGPLGQRQLAAHYAAADAFVCLSEHEGTCGQVLDAMRMGIPVVARDSAGVRETLGGTGVVVRGTDPLVVAETVARVVSDEALRQEVVRRQRERAGVLDAIDRDGALVSAMRTLAG